MNLPGVYNIFLEKMNDYQTCYMISDTHFGDKDIQKAFPNRPSDEELVKLINSRVGRKDVLWILGDCGDIEYVKKLHGYKILLLGNHDTGVSNYQRQKWIKRFDKDKFQKDEAIAEMKHLYPGCSYTIFEGYDFHTPFEYWEIEADNKLFDMVFSGPVMLGEKLILSHEPVDKIDWAVNLHGHNHNGSKKKDYYHFNVCADVIGYEPINFNQWLKNGPTARIKTIHRDIIDKATLNKRGRKSLNKKN